MFIRHFLAIYGVTELDGICPFHVRTSDPGLSNLLLSHSLVLSSASFSFSSGTLHSDRISASGSILRR